jgi:hypothetical protein
VSPFGIQQVRASTLALILIGLNVIMDLVEQRWLMLAGSLAGAAVGWWLAGGKISGVSIAREPSWSERFRKWRLRRRYRVIPGGRDTRSHLN